ncbi:hypothetical protein LZ32DRAFT_242419 [Colletotrichum eremochloae]|nr:hypothetical protein LZ32DRAFT_242419 [Colletotrichum eremochloae]
MIHWMIGPPWAWTPPYNLSTEATDRARTHIHTRQPSYPWPWPSMSLPRVCSRKLTGTGLSKPVMMGALQPSPFGGLVMRESLASLVETSSLLVTILQSPSTRLLHYHPPPPRKTQDSVLLQNQAPSPGRDVAQVAWRLLLLFMPIYLQIVTLQKSVSDIVT